MTAGESKESDGRLTLAGDEILIKNVIDPIPSYVLMVDSDHRIVMANEAFLQTAGLKLEQVIGAFCPKLVHGVDGPFPGCPVEEAAATGQSVERELYDAAYDSWKMSCAYLTNFVTIDNKPVFLHIVADVTETRKAQEDLLSLHASLEETVAIRTLELESANEELHTLARRDSLTGLPNRRAGEERLAEEFVRMQRTGVAYAVMIMDIDFFKQVNDTSGHAAGDTALKTIASVLGESIRQSDFAARFGGEEFLVVLPHTDAEGALRVAESIRQAVEGMQLPKAGDLTVSIGLAVADVGQQDAERVVREADRELYRAKQAGRNRVMHVGM